MNCVITNKIYNCILLFCPFENCESAKNSGIQIKKSRNQRYEYHLGIPPNQRRIRQINGMNAIKAFPVWYSSKSTQNARMAFYGYECHWRHARLACHMIPGVPSYKDRSVFSRSDLRIVIFTYKIGVDTALLNTLLYNISVGF